MIKIAVRSYGRSDTILKKTLGVLKAQTDLDLRHQLVLAVTEDQIDQYRETLKDYPMLDMIITEPGGYNATNALIDYFEFGDQVIFMDDDISKVQCYRNIEDASSRFDVTNLGQMFKYAFDSFNSLPFGFDFTPNLMFKQSKPFAEIKPRKIGGAWWGGSIQPGIFKTKQSHEDDNIRTAACLNRFGAVGSINWLTAVTAVGTNPGGMQSSSDRGSKEDRANKTLIACNQALEEPFVRKYYQPEPVFIESMNFYSLRLKNIRDLRKLPNSIELKWSSYLQQFPDEDSNLEAFF